MASKVGTQDGIEATRIREGQLHPEYTAAWDKRAATLATIKQGYNELLDRVAKLEQRQSFP